MSTEPSKHEAISITSPRLDALSRTILQDEGDYFVTVVYVPFINPAAESIIYNYDHYYPTGVITEGSRVYRRGIAFTAPGMPDVRLNELEAAWRRKLMDSGIQVTPASHLIPGDALTDDDY